MATGNPALILTFKSKSDNSAKQYHLVELTAANEVDVINAATDKPIGVLQNKPKAGEDAEVMVVGLSKVNSDAALSVGDLIGPAADGQAAAKTPGTDTTNYVLGIVVEASGAAAELAVALINGCNPHRAA